MSLFEHNEDDEPPEEHPGWLWALVAFAALMYAVPWLLWLYAHCKGGHAT